MRRGVGNVRWTPERKAEVLLVLDLGEISEDEVCRRHASRRAFGREACACSVLPGATRYISVVAGNREHVAGARAKTRNGGYYVESSVAVDTPAKTELDQRTTRSSET